MFFVINYKKMIQAINLEPSLNPPFVKKMKKIKKEGHGKVYSSVKEAKKDLL